MIMMKPAFCLRGPVLLNTLLSWLFKVFLFVMALLFFAGLFILLLLSLIFSLVRWLFTGRRPEVKVVMQRYRGWQTRSPLSRHRKHVPEVVDAEVREITPNTLNDRP